MKKLKMGIIVDNMSVPKYYHDFIYQLLDQTQYFHSPIIINQNLGNLNQTNSFFLKLYKKVFNQGLSSLFLSIISKIIILIESTNLSKIQKYKQYNKQVALDDRFEILEVIPEISRSGFIYKYNNSAIDALENLQLDLLIRFGSGILRGRVLEVSKFGILSLHHGDNREFRGMPAGFWEVFHAKPTTGFIIQQLTEELDAGNVLFRGNIMTASYWLKNVANIQLKSMFFFLKLLKDISTNNALPPIEVSEEISKKIYKYPSSLNILKYAAKTYLPKLLEKLKLFLNISKKSDWRVAFLRSENFMPNLEHRIIIQNPKKSFLADPFLIDHNKKTYCFVEEFCYEKNKGKISSYLLSNDFAQPLGTALEETFHLSFPFLIKHNNDIYMIPESASNKDIRLYKNIEFPNKWILEKVLMTNVDAADTIVFNKDDKWFMLTNICSSSLSDHQSELHLFSSTDLISDRWKPADHNPIIFNSLKARNGGYFKHKDNMYRVNQVHDKSHYGKKFEINLITDIASDNFVEENLSIDLSDFFRAVKSSHHFDRTDSYVVFDFLE